MLIMLCSSDATKLRSDVGSAMWFLRCSGVPVSQLEQGHCPGLLYRGERNLVALAQFVKALGEQTVVTI